MAADEDVLVLAAGMISAVGLSAAETAANVRANTMRFSESPWYDGAFEPMTLAEVVEDGLPEPDESLVEEPDLPARAVRLLRLGALPLLACLEVLGPVGPKTELHLALPETETQLPLDGDRLLQLLAIQTGNAFDVKESTAVARGRAGGLLALGQAAQRVHAGDAVFALAGGIDTYRDSFLLGTLDMEGRLKSSFNLDGFVPGEGASFVVLGNAHAAAAAKLKPLARLTPVFEGFEVGHLYSDQPYRGEGLAEVFQKFRAGTKLTGPIQEVYSSMNGEVHWSREWGVTFLRNQDAFDPAQRIHHPADSLGDIGAACGTLLVGLAALGIAGGYRRSPTLVYASSDRGPRAVVGVQAF